ncbi:Ig-like domain-containing protein [Brevibacillus sp. SYSU BS000544]|uniref:Ig-like domain-containing protein n=1 Tax=Brevibacillus sp. SYSU BS000544 TaxID=3416443 RepID=UPI003CE47D4C
MVRIMKRVLAVMLALTLVITGSFTTLPISKADAATKDSINGDWSKPYAALYDTEEADLMVRVGDIDNLGFDWEKGYDPFSGNSTRTHDVTFKPQEWDDPSGTDQLMVISAFTFPSTGRNNDYIADGYTRSNGYSRSSHPVVPIQISYDLKYVNVESAILQMFIDDYQPMKPEEVNGIKPRSLKYTVELDGVRAPFIEKVINSLNQHGPIGKLISVQVPDEFLPLLRDGRLRINIDDKTTQNAYGDGAAIDFVKLLINPNQLKKTGTIKGAVIDKSNSKPLANVEVSASGVVNTTTNANGEYILSNVPAGMVVIEAKKADYLPTTRMIEDFAAGTTLTNINLALTKRPKNNADLSNLTVNSGSLVPLTPVFDGDTTAYDVYLNSNISSVQVTPTSEDSMATLTVNGQAHDSGTAKNVSVKPGETVVSIVVTAQDGVTTKTYSLKVHTPMTNFEATRGVAPSIVKIGETAAITFTIKPNPISLDAFGQTPSTSVLGIRPFFLLDNNFRVNTQYDMETELNRIDSKGNSNGGALALGGTGKANFRDKMDEGYKQAVSIGQTLTSEPSGKTSDIIDELKDLITKGDTQIIIPITDEDKVMQGRDSITVDGFATFRLSLSNGKVKGTYLGSPQTGSQAPTSIVVKNVTYSELLPSDIQIIGITSSTISGISGSIKNDRYTVNLPNIIYTKQGNEFKANDINFTITVKADKSGTYLFNDAKLEYTEQDSLHLTNYFNNISLQVELVVPERVILTPNQATINIGQTVQFSAKVLPDQVNQKVIWSSSNTTIATVDQTGLVRGDKDGTVTIKATTEDGTKFGEAIVNVVTPVTAITLSPTQKTLRINEQFKLIASVVPENATNKAINWSSSNPSVATVDENGVVTGVQAGKAIITVSSAENPSIKATCEVTVIVPVTSVSLNKTETVLRTGQTDQLIATILPLNATNKAVDWSSSDPSVVTVTPSTSNGFTVEIKALKKGTAVITVTTEDGGKTATCLVTVREAVDSLTVEPNSATIYIAETKQLTATISPSNAPNKNVIWSSSNPAIAEVSQTGLVNGIAVGSVTITATSEDGGIQGHATITVLQPMTGIKVNPNPVHLNKGDSTKLTVEAIPQGVQAPAVTWKSSDISIASVDSNGLVTAVKAGEAVITATTVDSKYSATSLVKVKVPVTGVELDEDAITLNLTDNKHQELHATVKPIDATNKNVIWSSSNEKVATVDKDGKVTAVGGGVATITVKTEEGGYTDTCTVTVSTRPEITVTANNGWNTSYSDKAVITVKVVYYADAWPNALDFRVNDVVLPRTAINGPTFGPDLQDGKKQAYFSFDVNPMIKNNGEVQQVLYVGPTSIAAKVTDRYQAASDTVSNLLYFHPETAFTAESEKEGTGVKAKGKVTATPTTLVMEDVEFKWISNPDLNTLSAQSPWKEFNNDRVSDNIPLNAGGQTIVAVAMMQDFNGNGKYTDKNEIAVRIVEIGGVLPEFTLKEQLKIGDLVRIDVRPDADTIDESTKWYYKDSPTGDWTEFALSDKDNYDFIAEYQKQGGKQIDTVVSVKAVTPLNDDVDRGATAIKTITLEASNGDGNVIVTPGDGGGKPTFSKVITINSDSGVNDLENRAKKLNITYAFSGLTESDIESIQATYWIGSNKFSFPIGSNKVSNSVTQLIKTPNGKTQTFTVKVEIKLKIKVYNAVKKAYDYYDETFNNTGSVTVKAKNTLK